MPKFSNGKITSSALFYNRGVPNSVKNFGKLTTVNYSMLKQLIIYNRNSGNSRENVYTMF
jgi:hypothetical protein